MADTQDTAVVDLEKGILQLAQLNNTIQAKHKTITDLEEKEKVLQSDIHALEKNKKGLEDENQVIFSKNKEGDVRRKEQLDSAEKNIQELHEKIEKEKLEIEDARILIAAEKAEAERMKAEAERLVEENKQVQAEVDSKTLEVKRLSEGRAKQIEDVKAEREANEAACKHLEILKGEVEKEKAEKEQILARIEEANKSTQERSDELIKQHQDAENMKRIAQQEQEAANFIKNESYKLTMIMRQALHTFVQMNGTEVRVKDITDEHRTLIIRDMLSQYETPVSIADFFSPEAIKLAFEALSVTTSTPIVVEEVKTPVEEVKTEETKSEEEVQGEVGKTDTPLVEEEKQEEGEGTDFKKLPKAQLAEFAKENYGLDLNIDDLTHAQMVQAIVDEIESKTQI